LVCFLLLYIKKADVTVCLFIHLKTFMGQQFLLCWASVLALVVLPSESALSSGCGKPLPSGFSAGQTVSMEVPATNGQPVRHYKVHLSANFKNNRGHAIVFSFHGHNGDMAKQEDLSQLSLKGVLINDAGIIAVYPKGKVGTDGQTAWQGAPYSAPGVDDVSPILSSSTSIGHELVL
jgi:polyhydroxybutyrate depolymerase